MPGPADRPPKGASDASERTELDDKFAAADVRGKVRKQTVRKMTDLVEENPDEAVGALRRWLHQDDR